MAPGPRFASQARVPLPGSEKQPVVITRARKSTAAKAPSPRKSITVSVVLAPKQPVDTQSLATPSGGRLTRAEFARRHGTSPTSLRLVKAFAKEFGLTVQTKGSTGDGTVQLSGSQAAMEKAFDVSLTHQDVDGASCRVRQGTINLPEELTGHVLAVLGLDNRPQAQPHFRVTRARASNISYTPVQVAQLYGFPAAAKATGQTIGIIELGGGFRTRDVKSYFKKLGMPAPVVTAVSVDGGKNKPSTASGADGEVMLDIEVCASVAPGAKIAVYFAPNTDQGFVDAISTAVHDRKNNPGVISISWGGPESSWTGQAMTALDAACQAAAALSVTITAASGDNGSSDGVAGTADHVDFPASSPHVLGCGGTKLTGQGSTITGEVVWNETAANEGATGGGVSAVFPLPAWQSGAGVPAPATPGGGRGVPDVAGNADPVTGYQVLVDGQSLVIGGTSAVAPLWAGLIALANAQNKKPAGFVNPVLYASGSSAAFRDITQGNNGSFTAAPGWDACTGLGSPVGAALIRVVAPASAGTGKGGGRKSAPKPRKAPASKKASGNKKASGSKKPAA